ncbi:MAG: peptidylprolyl isomerase [Phycisphaerales bacterium]|nr:peptidylprolyl isomerase [Phycisphaerales bacterium]
MTDRAVLAVAMALAMVACLLPVGCRSAPTPGDDAPVYVRMDTTLGAIFVELDPAHAPISVANFLAYVDAQEYDNTIFHRVVRDFVIQGGGISPELVELPDRGTIRNEWLSGLKNERGTIAMAREAEPHTATRQWYINLVDNPRLDTARPQTGHAGYAVFGRVVAGMDVVDAIGRLATRARGAGFENLPIEVPIVVTIRRVDGPSVNQSADQPDAASPEGEPGDGAAGGADEPHEAGAASGGDGASGAEPTGDAPGGDAPGGSSGGSEPGSAAPAGSPEGR